MAQLLHIKGIFAKVGEYKILEGSDQTLKFEESVYKTIFELLSDNK